MFQIWISCCADQFSFSKLFDLRPSSFPKLHFYVYKGIYLKIQRKYLNFRSFDFFKNMFYSTSSLKTSQNAQLFCRWQILKITFLAMVNCFYCHEVWADSFLFSVSLISWAETKSGACPSFSASKPILRFHYFPFKDFSNFRLFLS